MEGLVDIGLNLGHDSFDADRDAVLERAARAGVARFVISGTSVTSSVRALELAKRRPGTLFATAGIHPHHARDFDVHSLTALRPLLDHAEVVAVGECGLDYFRDFSPRDLQQRAFVAQLELAAESRRPVFLHQRDAHEDFLRLLRPFRDALAGGVAHCFTGGPRELEDCLELDLYIGVTGWLCDERRGAALREAAREIPLERLLIETDAPYLLPRDLQPKPRSRRNEPCYLPHILERLAALRAEPVTLLAETTRRNSEELFRLTPPA
jgi:TatD DNase family protein